jgi:hypothetical protein
MLMGASPSLPEGPRLDRSSPRNPPCSTNARRNRHRAAKSTTHGEIDDARRNQEEASTHEPPLRGSISGCSSSIRVVCRQTTDEFPANRRGERATRATSESGQTATSESGQTATSESGQRPTQREHGGAPTKGRCKPIPLSDRVMLSAVLRKPRTCPAPARARC